MIDAALPHLAGWAPARPAAMPAAAEVISAHPTARRGAIVGGALAAVTTSARRRRIGPGLSAAAVVAAAVAAGGCGAGHPAAHREPSAARSEAKVRRALDELVRAGVPGAIVLVRDGHRTLRLASGYGNLAAKAPLRPTDRFRIGSLSKSFVATVVLQLVGEGKLTLRDSVERWLPGLVPNGVQITVRELLNHTSGLFDYTTDPRFIGRELRDRAAAWTPREMLRLATAHKAQFEPGAWWSYSNTGYVVLGLIPGNREKISKTTTTYLRALADGHTATACAQLSARARGDHCPQALKARLAGLNPKQLNHAADAAVNIDVHGTSASTKLAQPQGTGLILIKVGGDWRIDSGYTVPTPATVGTPPARDRIPATPVGRALAWVLAELNGNAARLTAQDVTARFSPAFRSVEIPARDLVAMLKQTAAERGPVTLTGFAFPPSATKAVALIDTKSGEKGSVRIELDGATPARILRFELSEAPATTTGTGRYSGRFDIGGRKLFLHCTGSGSPTVVFSGGLSSDWAPLQDRVARFTRACSYDPANALWGRSDPVPTPRTATDVVVDLHALLGAARVPGPYVLAGHSDGGLFAQLYASRHPEQVKGLVLLDAVSSQYHPRRVALLKRLLPPAQFTLAIRQLRAPVPTIVDPEQIDIETSEAQTRAALAAHPLRAMPLFVVIRGRSPDPNAAFGDDDERLWRQLQDGLAALVPHSRHAIATHSDHDIHHQQPDLVNAAVRDVVQAVRHPATWKTH